MERICQKCEMVNHSAKGEDTDACPKCGAIYSKVDRVMALQAKLAAQEAARSNTEKKTSPASAQKTTSPTQKPPSAEPPSFIDFINKVPRPLLYVGIWFAALIFVLAIPGSGPGAVMLMGCIGVVFLARAILGRAADRNIICPNPNCGFRGKARRRARGNTFIGLILCLFFLIPGVLYFIFKSGYRYFCPNCNMQIGSDS